MALSTFERIKKLAERRGKSLRQVAFDIGISENYLYRFKNQSKKPGGEMLEKLADYFHVSTDYLLGRSEENKELTVDEALDHAMSFNGKPISDHDREVVKSIVEAYLNKQNEE